MLLACLDMLRARAYSPTVAALWLRIQTHLNHANVHRVGQRFHEESFLGLIVIRVSILQHGVAAQE